MPIRFRVWQMITTQTTEVPTAQHTTVMMMIPVTSLSVILGLDAAIGHITCNYQLYTISYKNQPTTQPLNQSTNSKQHSPSSEVNRSSTSLTYQILCSNKLTTYHYPEPAESSPQHSTLVFKIHFNVIPPPMSMSSKLPIHKPSASLAVVIQGGFYVVRRRGGVICLPSTQ